MHPAFSVIFFTVFSGAGYGVLAALALGGMLGVLPTERAFALSAFGLGISAVGLGLLSSTFHLGRPERAWRAFSQWRTSWLSREGVLAMVTFVPVVATAYVWAFEGSSRAVFVALCALSLLGCVLTVCCTGMIYASLKTVPAWNNHWTVPNYLSLGAAGGGVWLWAILSGFETSARVEIASAVIVLLGVAFVVKTRYWRAAASDVAAATPGRATGLDRLGRVRVFETPHNQANYLMKEMGFQLARKHAAKLRGYAVALGFAVPVILVGLSLLADGVLGSALAFLAAFGVCAGQLVERWLFFAEAKHVVMSYYGE